MKRRSLNKKTQSDVPFGEAKGSNKPKSPVSVAVEKFQKKSFKCKNFFWKHSEEKNLYGRPVGPSIAYCKLTNESCTYIKCPLIKK